jgi:predicted ATPase
VIEPILAHTEKVKILATSREGLRLSDEQLWPVPSLDIDSSAAELFLERASAVSPTMSLGKTITRLPRSAVFSTGYRSPSNWLPRAYFR